MIEVVGTKVEYQISVPILGSSTDQRLIIASCDLACGVASIVAVLLDPQNHGPTNILIETRVK
jgi:hypothetical protein